MRARRCWPVGASQYVQLRSFALVNDDWIGALFQLDWTNRIINGYNLGNTWGHNLKHTQVPSVNCDVISNEEEEEL